MEKAENTIVVQTERKWGCLCFFLVFVIGVAVGFYATERHFRDATKMLVDSDTTYVYDTTRIVLPPVTNHIHTTDTMLVVVKDTIVVHDTTFVVLQKDVKEYRGEEYYAKISGYNPMLDYIEVYPKTTVVNNTEVILLDRNSLSFGLEAAFVEKFYLPIYLEYHRRLRKNVGMKAKLLYDLPSKTFGAEAGMYVEFGW